METILPPNNGRIPPAPDCPHDGSKEDPAVQQEIKRRFLQHERFIRNELMRFKLSQREQNVAVWILQASFGNQRKSIMIPSYDIFRQLLDYSPSHVSETIAKLKNMRILLEEKKAGGTIYSINTDSRHWQVAPRVSREQVSQANQIIRRFNNLPVGQDHKLDSVNNDIKNLIESQCEPAPATDDLFGNAEEEPDEKTPGFLTDSPVP